MKKSLLFLTVALALVLCACGASEAPAATTAVTVPTVIETTVPETAPETEPVPETTEPTVAETEPAVEEVAQRITEGVSFYVQAQNFTKPLSDDWYTSRVDFRSARGMILNSEEPFSAFYMMWDTLPGVYTVHWEGGSLECGQNGFHHEYVRLPEAVTSVTLEFHEETYLYLCEVRLYTAGAAPEDVQLWLPPCEQADILAFPTHADDDVLFFGGAISYYKIEKGLTVQTAFMTKQGNIERTHERLNGLWEMGIRHYPILGNMGESASHSREEMEYFHKNDNLKGWQVEQIRRFKPLVIIGHDLDGEYGNGQHKLNAYYLTMTVDEAADPTLHEESAALYGTWDTPKLYLHLYEENPIILDVNTPMVNDELGRTPFEVAEDAYEHHKSQHIYPFWVSQDDYEQGMDCKRFGLYRSLVGADTAADMMENIDASQWR